MTAWDEVEASFDENSARLDMLLAIAEDMQVALDEDIHALHIAAAMRMSMALRSAPKRQLETLLLVAISRLVTYEGA